MEQLTENIIKKITLRFFRHYYKFRLRYDDQPVTAKYDLEGAGGIIADGYYSFKKTDGKPFVATFEATSHESKDEVSYKPQKKVLFWDGLAIASVFTAFVFGLNYLYNFHQLDEREILTRAGLVALSFAVALVTFYFVAKQFRRYRYIYAVEQFKKYHADEQWIALGQDVFEDPNDKQFQELKNQCVFNGFGLLMVDNNLDPKILITPSRHDVFKGKRQAVSFLSKSNFLVNLSKRANASWWGVFGSKLPQVFKADTSIQRFRKTFYHQMLITGISLALTGIIFYKEMQRADYITVDKDTFRTDIAQSRSNNLPEQDEYIGDSASTPRRKVRKEDYWLLNDETAGTVSVQPKTPGTQQEIFVRGTGKELIIYDCSRLYTFNGRMYLVEEGEYKTADQVNKRLEQLYKAKMEAMAMPLNCFNKDQPGYVVFLGMIYTTENEANLKLNQFKSKNLSGKANLKIRPIDL